MGYLMLESRDITFVKRLQLKAALPGHVCFLEI